jgi:imidazolonepropionase
MEKVDFILQGAKQLVTCAGYGKPKRGSAMQDVGIISDGALAVEAGKIVALGTTAEVRDQFNARRIVDVGDRTVCPGFVDPHTHLVFGGDRVAEFEMRIKGASYMEIMEAGGGIISTMKATREMPLRRLVEQSLRRLKYMFDMGTTTIEVKTGYGLDTASELKMLQVIADLDVQHPADVIPTFLGAHAVPPEFKGRTDDYVNLVINEMLPVVQTAVKDARINRLPFCDVFCEENAFDLEQTRKILEAGRKFEFPIKIHADEFNNLGGVGLAIEMDAVSVDHLDVTNPDEIKKLAESFTVAVLLPAVNFNLGSSKFADARAMIDAGVTLALATDYNPGSAPCLSMPLTMAIACRYQRITPAEALNACTINAAWAIGMGNRVGSLEVGKQADILILDVPDYRHLSYQFGVNLVNRVIKKGKIVVDHER